MYAYGYDGKRVGTMRGKVENLRVCFINLLNSGPGSQLLEVTGWHRFKPFRFMAGVSDGKQEGVIACCTCRHGVLGMLSGGRGGEGGGGT